MNEFQPLIDQLYREEILRARALTLEQRFLGTFELCDFAFRIGGDAVGAQLPDASPAEREREWQRRLRIARLLDEHGIYAPVSETSGR